MKDNKTKATLLGTFKIYIHYGCCDGEIALFFVHVYTVLICKFSKLKGMMNYGITGNTNTE